jgi:[ribosomal protein S18]-alanine N-acetyltransferase
MTDICIRKLQKEDVEGIMEIEKVSFGAFHWSAESFSSEIDNIMGNYFTAIDKETGKVIGYAGFWLILDEAHITTIAVRPELRGQHYGEVLLQQLIEECYNKRAKWITLEVRASNTAAQNLYYKYDFKSLGLRKKYYQDNDEDALIMWTENIWDTKFKEKLASLKEELKNKLVNV